MILDKDPNKDKLSKREIEGIFIGYPQDRKGYRLWVPEMRKYIREMLSFFEDTKAYSLDVCKIDDLFPCDDKCAELNKSWIPVQLSHSEAGENDEPTGLKEVTN